MAKERVREIKSDLEGDRETETEIGMKRVMQSFNKHLLSAHPVLSTILGAGDTEVNKIKCLLLKRP